MPGVLLRRRLALAAAAIAATLGCAGAANGKAADAFVDSRLEIASTTFAGETSTGFGVELGNPDSGQVAVAAHVDVTIPAGYGLDLTGVTGTKVADFAAIAMPPGTPAGVDLLLGDVAVEDPTAYAADPVAQACAPGAHAAYWQATLESLSQGSNVLVPIAVDATQDAGGATIYTIRFCPLAAPSTDRPSGVALVYSFLTFSQISVPSTAGTYQWSALVTPATATLTPDPASAFELRGDIPIPQTLTLRARYEAKPHAAVLTGRLLAEGKPRAGVKVTISREGELQGDVVTTTKPDGSFLVRENVAKTQQFDAVVGTVSSACTAPSTAPGGCRDESLAGASSLTAVLVRPRTTDPKLATRLRDQSVARRSVVTPGDLPGAHVIGDAPPPCPGFAPNVHRLTETGDQRSSMFLTADRNAEIYTTASVFGTVDEAKADLAAVAQIAGARCEATGLADGTQARVATLRRISLPKIGNDVRGFRATVVGDGLATLNVEVLVVRVSRVVITLHLLSIGPANGLDLSLARALARRAR